MGGFIRFGMIVFVVLTVIYICLSLYSRAVRRDKLEQQWQEEGAIGDKRAFVSAGLQVYRHSLRRKLILGVYLVPMAVVGTIVYLVNYT